MKKISLAFLFLFVSVCCLAQNQTAIVTYGFGPSQSGCSQTQFYIDNLNQAFYFCPIPPGKTTGNFVESSSGGGGGGTITGITASTGLSGGGASGNVSLSLTVPVTRANGGLNSTTPGTGFIRDGSTPTAGEVAGDCATSGSFSIICTKTNNNAFGTLATQNGTIGTASGDLFTNLLTTIGDEFIGGASGVITRLAAPSTPSGVAQTKCDVPGNATTWCLPGLSENDLTSGSPYTLASTDCGNPIFVQTSTAYTIDVPIPATLGVPKCAFTITNNISTTNTNITVTPTTYSIVPASAGTIAQGQSCRYTVGNASNTWDADCHDLPTTYSTGLTATRGQYGPTITSSGGGTTLTYWMTSGYSSAGQTAVTNVLTCGGFVTPTAVSTGHIAVNVSTADNTNLSSLEIYGSTGTLLGSITPFTSAVTGTRSFAWSQGTITIPASKNYFCITSVGSTFAVQAFGNSTTFYPITQTAIASSGGAAPSSITPPSDVPTVVGNLPNFLLYP